ncbi:unnamed protein product, partial [Prorocentrum cordatum]
DESKKMVATRIFGTEWWAGCLGNKCDHVGKHVWPAESIVEYHIEFCDFIVSNFEEFRHAAKPEYAPRPYVDSRFDLFWLGRKLLEPDGKKKRKLGRVDSSASALSQPVACVSPTIEEIEEIEEIESEDEKTVPQEREPASPTSEVEQIATDCSAGPSRGAQEADIEARRAIEKQDAELAARMQQEEMRQAVQDSGLRATAPYHVEA